jgi:hypothetical protein
MGIKQLDNRVYLGLYYSKETFEAIELILSCTFPKYIEKSILWSMFPGWSSVSSTGEIFLYTYDYVDKDNTRAVDFWEWYLNSIMQEFLDLRKANKDIPSDRFIKRIKDIQGYCPYVGKGDPEKTVENAKIIASEMFMPINEQSKEFAVLRGVPFNPIKQASIEALLNEMCARSGSISNYISKILHLMEMDDYDRQRQEP